MSHYTVTVRLTKERMDRAKGDVKAALKEIMAPFYENTKDPQYLEFKDTEDEYRLKFDTESSEMVITPSGERICKSDKRFETWDDDKLRHVECIPEGCEVVTIPHKERYKTFGAFMKEYCGYDAVDEKTGRYGYWHNPNAKWDWYQIGGRWAGHFPVKSGVKRFVGELGLGASTPPPGKNDVVRVGDIDLAACAEKQVSNAEKFWGEWCQLLEGKKFPPFEGPRDQAMTMGLLRVEKDPNYEAKSDERLFWWKDSYNHTDDRKDWSDVAKVVTKSEFIDKYFDYFDPLNTYAFLSDDGWVEPGKMGWWGCSSDTPETKMEFVKSFRTRTLGASDPEDYLVCVDCHI